MWTTVALGLLMVLALVDHAQSEGNSSVAPTILKFKKNVHRLLEGSRIRLKRQLYDMGDPSEYKLRIDSATPADLPYLSDYNLTFWIPVYYKQKHQVLVGTTQGHLLLFELSDADGSIATTVAISDVEDIALKATAFSHYDEQWFSVLHTSVKGYYIRLYKRIGRGLERNQQIVLSGNSDMVLVSMKGIHYLVVSTYSATTDQGISYQAAVVLYQWIHTQFDQIASRDTFGARSIACWILDGSLYIAVGQEVNDEGNSKVGTPVLFYNSKEEDDSLVLWQMLDTFGPIKVQHFYVAGSHYVIFIGRRDAVIYWWSHGQFLEWQTLSGTAYAMDLSILSLNDGEVAIVIGLKETAIFYTLDASGYYIVSLTMSFKQGSTLASLQFMFSRGAYYALALFEGNQQSIWRLTVKSHYLPSIESLDPLNQCLSDTKELLKQRETELDSIKEDSKRVWLKGNNQTITSKVNVKGQVISPKTVKTNYVTITVSIKLPDSSMAYVINALISTRDSMEDVKINLDGVVRKASRQNIRGTLGFNHVYVPSLTMEAAYSGLTINDVPLYRVVKSALRKAGDQVFHNGSSASNVHTDRVNAGTLNGISTEDLLLLHGSTTVSGDLHFSSVEASTLSTETVNYLPIEDIVTTTSNQVIHDLKEFSSLHSDVIEVTGEINGVDLGSVGKNIATVDDYNEIHGRLIFQNPLTIDGSLFLVGKVNKAIDLSTLISQSVTRDSQQDLTGLFRFKDNTVIDGDLLVAGSINRISIDNLLTLASHQNIYADMSFSATLKISNDLSADLINDIDLNEQALRKLPPHQFISGLKTFTRDILTDFVDMTEYVTLDGTDPSHLVQDIVQHRQGVVKSNSTSFKDVVVLGNVTAIGGINGFEVLDLLSTTWMKNTDQNIIVPVKANFFHFNHDLDVGSVNNLNLDKDIVHSYSNEVITSAKEFSNKLNTMRNLKLSPGVTINGYDLKSLKTQLGKYENDGTIHGTKTINYLRVEGNLRVDKLNEESTADIMQQYGYQVVHGQVEFPSEIIAVEGNTESKVISSGVFNGIDLQDYFRRAVVSNEIIGAVKNKDFRHIKATNLSVPISSKIDGVSLHEMLQRVVTLNVPQRIPSEKTFASTHFSKLISVSTLNELDLYNYIKDVVLTDEVSQITNKQFVRNTTTTNVFVRGKVNGIKIEDMAANVFYKSEDNEVTQPFVFKGDVEIGYLTASSILDGMEWKHLIFLNNDEILGPGWFLNNINVHNDIYITGLLNGCDLSELASKSIYTNKSTQVITEQLHVHNIFVIGNVVIKNRLNKISVELMEKFITTSEDQLINSDVVIEADLSVKTLYLTNLSNAADISEIVRDAVRNSVAQDIKGQKVFKENLYADVMTGVDVYAHKVNGIILEELYKDTVWKHGHKEIHGDKIFSQLFTNVATVNGYINGLKLPQDVVLTDTSEYINHPTFFMSDVYVPTDVAVHGSIDGVDINKLILERVTLNSDQNISAHLSFRDDIALYDDLTIHGMVNEVVLELVARVNTMEPLQGYKMFVELHLSGPVTTSTVNGYDVPALASNILRYNRDDYINEVQVFEKPIIAETLYVDWINGASLKLVIEKFSYISSSLTSTLRYLEDFSSSLQNQLTRQLSIIPDHVSRFAYFTLFQELDMGPTTKILYSHGLEHITSEFSHSMVIWTTQRHCVYMEKCCHLEYSYQMRVKKNADVMVEGGADSGRYYPINDPTPVFINKNYFVWTNTTSIQPKWCSEDNQKMFLSSYNEQGILEVFVDIEGAPLLSEIKSFRKGNLYSVAGFFYDTKHDEYSSTVVYVYEDYKRQWSQHQTLPSFGVLSLDLITYSHGYSDEILLAVGTGVDAISSTYSTVYRWNNKVQLFETLQDIPSRHVTSTLWILKGRSLLLALAGVDHCPRKHVDCVEMASGGEINIYTYYKEHLKWIQSIPLGGVVSLTSFSVAGDVFIAAASIHHQTVYIYEWQGYSNFVEVQKMFVGEVRHISTYTILDDTYMTVALVSGPSKILKMVRQGQHSISSRFDPYNPELKDDSTKVISGC